MRSGLQLKRLARVTDTVAEQVLPTTATPTVALLIIADRVTESARKLLTTAGESLRSRRIDDEHRLVYAVETNEVTIISCRYHYE